MVLEQRFLQPGAVLVTSILCSFLPIILSNMTENKALIILGTAHRMREPGKQSPDKRIKECVYSREICKEIAEKLRVYGCKAEIDYEPLDLPKNMQSAHYLTERSRELAIRVNYVNELCKQNGVKNVLYVSIHLNAAGSDDQWHNASWMAGMCQY